MVHTNLYNTLFGKNQKGGNGGNLVSFGKNKNFFKLLDEKKEFLMLVFANLIVQLGITYYIMENSKNKKEKLDIKMWILLVIGLFALIFVMLYETTFGPLLSLPKTKPSAKSLHIVTIWFATTGSGFTVTVTVKGLPEQPTALTGTIV